MEAQIINGIKFIDQGQIDEILYKGEDFYEEWMLTCIKKLGYMPGVWIDVGAHVGNHTIYFCNHCGADEVWAYEPTPETFKVLVENVKNNCKNRVRCFRCAVGANKGFCELVENERSGQNKVQGTSGTTEMEVLGDISARVALIKIDVEGLEFEVLAGAMPVIKRDLPELFVESFEPMEKILDLLPKKYRFIQRYNNAPTYHFSAK